MPFTQKNWNGVGSCIASGKGEGTFCHDFCSQGINLGVESKWFHGDMPYLATVWYNFVKAAQIDHTFDKELLEIVKYTNDYAKYKHSQGSKPTAPVSKRYYKLSQLAAVHDDTKGKDLSKLSVDSELKSLSFRLSLKTNFREILSAVFVGFTCLIYLF
jgi:hypothetical protein